MSIVWPCPLDVDAYVERGREIESPRPSCPLCSGPTGGWSGYERHLRDERDRLIWMLETERSRMSEIIEALPVGVGIVAADGRVILGNSVMKQLNGPIIQSMTTAPRACANSNSAALRRADIALPRGN